MIQNKNTKLMTNSKYTGVKTRQVRKVKRTSYKLHFILAILAIVASYYALNNYRVASNDPVAITDDYIDCVNLGKCEDLTETTTVLTIDEQEPESVKTEQAIKGNSKLGEVVTHKGVYINKAILDAIDAKFAPADAKKLKTIMLAECAMDYKVDGVVTYECKSTTVNKNPNGTYDCGYLQLNKKTPCTSKDFAVDYQVEMAYKKLNNLDGEVCGKWNCWSSYKFKDSKQIKTAYNMWANK